MTLMPGDDEVRLLRATPADAHDLLDQVAHPLLYAIRWDATAEGLAFWSYVYDRIEDFRRHAIAKKT